MTKLAFEPFIPWWALIACVALAVILTVPFIMARRRTAVWRALGFAALLIALANPRLVIENREKLRDTAVLVVDRTGSQTIAERTRQTDAARAEMQKRLAAVEGVDLRVVEVEDGGKDDGTRLFRALSSAIGDLPRERIAGVVAITDGIIHDVPADPTALGFGGPFHALITGHPGERDRRIELVEAPRFGLVNKDVTIKARVLDPGFSDPVPVTVSVDGQRLSSSEAKPGEVLTIPVPVSHAGRIVVEIDAAPAKDELTLRNNKAVVTLEGVRERLRVLLVSGAPHAGERVWRNLLKSDPSVDLVHFTILRPPEKSDGTPINELALIAFPQKELFEEKLHDFDLVIFDRFTNNITLPQRYFGNIADYVRGGGALLISAGPEFIGRGGLWNTQLEPVLPAIPDGRIIETPYRAHVGIEGQRHPVTRNLPNWDSKDNPWGEWLRAVGRTRARRPCGARRTRSDGASRSCPRRRRPRRPLPHRSALALAARLRGRRPLHRSLAALVALADEGARARRGGVARDRGWARSPGRAPNARRQLGAGRDHRRRAARARPCRSPRRRRGCGRAPSSPTRKASTG